MNENTQILDKDKILSTVSRQILYNCLLKGMMLKDAAKEANLSYKYARKLVTTCNINALARQTTAKLSEKAGISIVEQQFELLSDIQAAREAKCWGAVMSGHATLLKSIGGMTGDRPHPDAMKGKELDTRKIEALRAIADAYYGKQYLAAPVPIMDTHSPMSAQEGVKQVQSTCRDAIVGQARPLEGPTIDDKEGQGQSGIEAQKAQKETPLPPKGPGPDDGTPSLHNAEGFRNA